VQLLFLLFFQAEGQPTPVNHKERDHDYKTTHQGGNFPSGTESDEMEKSDEREESHNDYEI